MSTPADILPEQLKQVCKAAGASWAATAERREEGWQLRAAHGLSAARLKVLSDWLAKRGDLKSRQPVGAAGLGVAILYAIPNADETVWLLAGANELKPASKAALQAVALGLVLPPELPPGVEQLMTVANAGLMFDEALARLRAALPAQAALLARRSGDEFRVEAIWQMPKTALGAALLPSGSPDLATLLEQPEGVRLEGDVARRVFGLPLSQARKFTHWLALPLMQGRRTAGLAVFSRATEFTEEEQAAAARAARGVTGLVRRAAAAMEALQVLERQQALEEAAGLAAHELELPELARRLQGLMLKRFPAENAELLVLSRDQKCLEPAAPARNGAQPERYPLDSTLVGAVARIGQTVRIGNFARQSQFASPRRGVAAKLAAPLTLHDQTIGVLSLESRRPDAFSAADEHALTMLARLAAGLVENVRLRNALAGRGAALLQLNELARQLNAAAGRESAAQVTAVWMAAALSADLVLVMMADDARAELVAEGVAGRRKAELPSGLRIARELGAPGEALQYGRSVLIHDAAESGDHFPVTGWEAGSALCVPLGVEGQWRGVLLAERAESHAFSAEDLDLVETAARLAQHALAGPGSARLTELAAANQNLVAELEKRKQAQVLAEERLVRSAKLAAVGEMAAGVAHELNNPLTTVSGFTELILEQMTPDSPMRADLELVLTEARRARAVVRRLLDFSRPSDVLRLPADLNDELTQALSLVHHMASTSGVEIRVSLWSELPPVRIDRNQMQQVFLNLIHNAVQAMPHGGQLTLHTAVQQQDALDFVTASVQDTGNGIRAEDLDKVFEPFFTTKPSGQGTGLGLSVSYGIVAEHGGFIDAFSEEGRGATFTVWLPVAGPGATDE
ncbi:MAG: GAF domain-containing protein [Anaerolineae bacterium]|nr:MAG: GAF domain-containing protein [Anaerolineae bacterium]